MGNKKVSIHQLEQTENFQLIKELNHQDMVPFILEEFQQRNLMIHLYVIFNLAILTQGIRFAIEQLQLGNTGLLALFLWWTGGAIAGSTLIVPLHELLHGLAYYWLGAKKVTYGANLREFYFFAAADRFVVNGRSIWPLALAPFMVISTGCIWLLQADFPTGLQALGYGLFSLHSLNCLGDFGMLSFFWKHRHQQLYTYDLVKAEKTLIYAQRT
jgi:hypothetical protein